MLFAVANPQRTCTTNTTAQGAGARPGSAGLRRGRPVPPQEGELDADVKAEEEHVQGLLQHRTGEEGEYQRASTRFKTS